MQIIPTTRGIGSQLSKGLGEEFGPASEKTGKDSGKKIGGGLKATLLKTVGGLAIGAAVAKGISTAINQGGKLQQSIGGVETLFKKSAPVVEANARKAFRTAGMSANDYMENVNSFAASLVHSTGGNTKQAANLADTAMKDMSDNANKMGTDLSSVTQTYQSLARGNYAMLDNLKLGYGGTKSELQRLMKDAEKLTGEHYTVGDFGDTVKAIHAIQGSLGITGTTAKEASTTLEGSFNQMKASALDFMGNLAIGKNVGQSFLNMLKSALNFVFNNFLPLLLNTITSLAKLATKGLKSLIDGSGGKAFDGLGAKIVAWLKQNIVPFLGALGELGLVLLQAIWKGLQIALPKLGGLILKGLAAAFTAAVNGLKSLLVTILQALLFPFTSVAKLAVAAFGGIKKGVVSVVKAMVNAVKKAFSVLQKVVSTIWKGVKTAITLPFKGAQRVVRAVWAAIKRFIVTPFKAAYSVVRSVAGHIRSAVSTAFGAVKSTVSRIWNSIKTAITHPISAAYSTLSGIFGRIRSLFSNVFKLNLKIPRVSLDGGKAPWGIAGKGRLPHFSVSWAAHGGILDGATLVGAGEAGKEAIVPLERNTGWMNTLADKVAARSSNNGGNTVVINMTVNGADDPEEWGRRLTREIQRQYRMA